MSAFVHWLAVEPVRWLVPLTGLACVVGIPLMLWWERRRAAMSARHPDAVEVWRALPAAVQAAHDGAVVDAAEAAERIVAEASTRVSRFYVPPSSVSSD